MGFFTGDPAVYLIAIGAAVKIHHGFDQGAERPTGSTPFGDSLMGFYRRSCRVPYRSRSSCRAVHPSVSSSVAPDATAAGISCDSRGSRTDAHPCASSRAAPASPSV